MAFKTVKQYNEERFGGWFMLRNDDEAKDVIFLYRSDADVLVADTHYIKSADYSGYVHCTGRGCPACGKNIRVQPKLFIPLYDIATGELLFWDRGTTFEMQLMKDVFEKYPNPSDYVFRITRHGAPRAVNTTYSIQAIATNTVMSYNDICRSQNITFPDAFERVCKDVTPYTLNNMLNSSASSDSSAAPAGGALPNYQITPRAPRSDATAGAAAPVPASEGVSVPAGDWYDTDPDDAEVTF